MIIQRSGGRSNSAMDFHAEVKFNIRPKITGEKIVDGIKYYLGDGGKEYIASLFDGFFKTSKGKIKKKNHRDLIGTAAKWQ